MKNIENMENMENMENIKNIEFNNEDELWNYIESNYDDNMSLLFLDLASYYEIKYTNNYVHNADIQRYNKAKNLDISGNLDVLAKKYFELIKSKIDKNLNKNKK